MAYAHGINKTEFSKTDIIDSNDYLDSHKKDLRTQGQGLFT